MLNKEDINTTLDREMHGRQVKMLKATIDVKDCLLAKQSREIRTLRDMYDGRWNQVHALRTDVDDRDRHVEELRDTIQLERIDHQAEMSAVKKSLNKTIHDLHLAGSDMQHTIDEYARREAKERLNRGEIDRLRRIVRTVDQAMRELSGLYCARGDQLWQIETKLNAVKGGTFTSYLIIIDEITKIIQEK